MGLLYLLGAFVAFITIATALYQLRLSHHPGVPRNEFIQYFRDRNVPDRVSETVYNYYRSSIISRKFGVSPEDKLADLFSDERRILKTMPGSSSKDLGIGAVNSPRFTEWGSPLITVGDMVLWLDWVCKNAVNQASR
jgi:hypothetical protein